MSEKKYSKVLITVSVIGVILIIALLGFLGYTIYTKSVERKNAGDAVNEAENNFRNPGYGTNFGNGGTTNRNNTDGNSSTLIDVNLSSNQQGGDGTSTVKRQTYKGYSLSGYIEIPSIKLDPDKMPILERFNSGSSDVAPGINYGPGLNKVGNTVIFGHNYRNGTHFSNLDKVKINDTIYVTDLYNGHKRVKYTVYNVYQTAANDFDYASASTQGKMEISLSTCYGDDNNDDRTIVQARAEE